MDWVKEHYSEQSKLIGKAKIRDSHRELAALLHRWCQQNGECRRLLELGAGACGLAAAMADYGYDVFAVEFNPHDLQLAQSLAAEREDEKLHVVAADFYDVTFDEKFDFIYYWDGFGVGDDSDQRRLLSRVGKEWLSDSGCAIIDVFSPWSWLRRSGEISTFTANDGKKWSREIQFDPINGRFRDLMKPINGSHVVALSQTIRVYSLQEFLLLVEGTGTRVDAFYMDFDRRIVPGALDDDIKAELLNSNGYYAKLLKSGSGEVCAATA